MRNPRFFYEKLDLASTRSLIFYEKLGPHKCVRPNFKFEPEAREGAGANFKFETRACECAKGNFKFETGAREGAGGNFKFETEARKARESAIRRAPRRGRASGWRNGERSSSVGR